MSKLEELIQRYQAEQARQAAQRQAEKEKEEAAERDKLLAINQALRERARPLLGEELFDELAPREPIPNEVIPLISGGGYHYALVREHPAGSLYLAGHGWRQKNIPLPAAEALLGKFFDTVQAERAEDAQRAYENALWANPDQADEIMRLWPDMAPTIQAVRAERIAQLTAQDEASKARHDQRSAQVQAEEQALLSAIQEDPVAVALVKLFSQITCDREKWQQSLDQLSDSLDNAYSDASRAKQRASDADERANRAASENRDAQYRADDAERKYSKLKRDAQGAERGW